MKSSFLLHWKKYYHLNQSHLKHHGKAFVLTHSSIFYYKFEILNVDQKPQWEIWKVFFIHAILNIQIYLYIFNQSSQHCLIIITFFLCIKTRRELKYKMLIKYFIVKTCANNSSRIDSIFEDNWMEIKSFRSMCPLQLWPALTF